MNDSTEDTVRAALHERGEQITPTPALPGILHRASRTRAPRRRWLPVAVAALASAGVLVGAVIVLEPDDSDGSRQVPAASDPTSQTTDEPAGDPVTVEPGSVVPMALHYVNEYGGGTLVSGEFEITSSGDVGVDAVQALIEREPAGQFTSYWGQLNADPRAITARARSVRFGGDLISVDFNRSLDQTCGAAARCAVVDGELALQQLVHTLQSVLRTDAPVLITVGGTPIDKAFDEPVDGPVAADPSVAPGIRVSSPEQGATVSGPVTVAGESTSNEGNLQWEALRDGEIVDDGFTTGGSMGELAPFEFSVDLAQGDYTIAVWEENAAGGSEGLARRLSPVYLDISVE